MYQHITSYRFTPLQHLALLQADMQAALQQTGVLGTVLLAKEGINLSLAGSMAAVAAATDWLQQQAPLADLDIKHTQSQRQPFTKLKVRIRREIISFDDGQTDPNQTSAPYITAAELDAWIATGKPFTLLDTRNDYEHAEGTFKHAHTLPITTFRDFPKQLQTLAGLDRSLPVVTFCTGGVRCEKAAPWLLDNGFDVVYQLRGGILAYLRDRGPGHWQGDCFVFDDRVSVDKHLHETGASICRYCQRVIAAPTAGAETGKRDIHVVCARCRQAQRSATATV